MYFVTIFITYVNYNVGDICQREILTCDEAPCKNGGTCFTDSLGVYCMCPDPYEGLFCQLQKGKCCLLIDAQ